MKSRTGNRLSLVEVSREKSLQRIPVRDKVFSLTHVLRETPKNREVFHAQNIFRLSSRFSISRRRRRGIFPSRALLIRSRGKRSARIKRREAAHVLYFLFFGDTMHHRHKYARTACVRASRTRTRHTQRRSLEFDA